MFRVIEYVDLAMVGLGGDHIVFLGTVPSFVDLPVMDDPGLHLNPVLLHLLLLLLLLLTLFSFLFFRHSHFGYQ